MTITTSRRAPALALFTLTLATQACGPSAPAPTSPTTPATSTPPPTPGATPDDRGPPPAPDPSPSAAAVRLPPLPYELPYRAPAPSPESDEGRLLARWARAVGFDPAAEDAFTFRAAQTDLALLGDARVVELSGHDSDMPRGDGGSLLVLDRDGTAGPALRAVLIEPPSSISADGTVTVERTPWLGGIGACDEAALPEPPPELDERLAPLVDCEDLVPQVARAFLARLDAETPIATPLDDVCAFLGELMRVASPASSLECLESARDVQGQRTPRARFVPLRAVRDETGLHAEGTLRLGGTCTGVLRYVTFTLEVTPDRITLAREPLATQTLDAHCL